MGNGRTFGSLPSPIRYATRSESIRRTQDIIGTRNVTVMQSHGKHIAAT